MDDQLLGIVRIANREFQDFVDLASKNNAKVVAARGAIRRLEKVNHRLQQITQLLAAQPRSLEPTPDEAYQLLKYRENLKALHGVMETLQFTLLAEKARLENVRANMQAACAWAASLQEIS